MILDYQPEYNDTNSIILNYNIVRNNGGHGIRNRGNALIGNLKEPGTGFNIIKDNGGYDLYVETPSTFVDTIWAQNNEWTHSTEEEVGQFDIFDRSDDPQKALVYFSPVLSFGTEEQGGMGAWGQGGVEVWPNPTHGKFQITNTKHQTNSNKQTQKYEVVDLFGNIMNASVCNLKSGACLEFGACNLEFDISDVPAGVYFLRIYFDNKVIVKKISKL
jgi:hypothetical protein